MYNFKEIEDNIRKYWKKNPSILKDSISYNNKKKLYSFLEGPPTANAPPALHHVEVRVFKDLFCKFKFMQGYTVPRKGGWDCHGLPVEVQIEKALNLNSKKEIQSFGTSKFIQKCRNSVFEYIKNWNVNTEKMAYWVDLKDPYITLSNEYIESVWWSLKELHTKDLLYQGHKVVPYCPRCETPLSSHEVAQGYKDVKEPAIYVKFKSKDNPNRFFLAFTTTPWTTISNVALIINKKVNYVVIKENKEEYILAENLVKNYFKNPKIIKKLKGKDLIGLKYEPLFSYFKNLKNSFRVIHGDFVSIEEGTGIVHAAAAFGEDDYQVCKENKIDFVQPVNNEGKFTKEVKDFEGMFVKKADKFIIEKLEDENKLFKKINYEHSYPHCWRCKTPLLYFAMKSWFVKVTKYKNKLIKNNKKINWYPSHLKEGRFGDWLENVKDWALSRSKLWGTPLPIWKCSCGHETAIGSIKELQKLSINKITKIDLHKPNIDKIKISCSKCKSQVSRVPEVIDCWYDSGSAPFAQYHYPFENKEMFKKSFPYDFIAEAIDQTRGWFYTMHVISTILFDSNAYKNVVSAGHLVDEKGEKMSKSKGNITDPDDMFDKLGVDAVRLQMCVTEPGDTKRISENLVREQVLQFLNILYNTYIYTKSYKEQFKFKKPSKPKKLETEDKYIISRVNTLTKNVTQELEVHNYHHCSNSFINFVNEDFSRFYIKLIRDRTQKKDVSLYYTLNYVFDKVVKLLAPFVPYLTEEIYQDFNKTKKSVHLDVWPKQEKTNPSLEKNVENIRKVIPEILSQREKEQISVRWPLKEITVTTKDPEIIRAVKSLKSLILQQTNIKSIKTKLDKKVDLQVVLDTRLTKELEVEGFTREIIRRIQALRKKAELKKENSIELFINTEQKLDEETIKKTVGAKVIKHLKSSKFRDEFSIKDTKFEIGFNVVK
ncbi:isoleucine--tRNA ligase [archaeon]|nr:isoleucine--tRNA ligase [archaeon]|tara:strand:- start:19011 stop:21824 length:2814 start_codon:yes stop_codon:yes gene_type:complete